MEPETKKPRTEPEPAATASSPSSSSSTLYVRCSRLHRRGELVNDFLYQHREALQIQDWYDAETHRLFADAPLEVVLVQTSRKPFFLVEWRQPTAHELGQRKLHDDHLSRDAEGTANEETQHAASNEASPVTVPSSEGHALAALTTETLEACAGRLLALGATTPPPQYNGEPVIISAAMPGATVAEARQKLHLRDLALKKVADEAKAQASSEAKPRTTVTSFVPRVVRRRN